MKLTTSNIDIMKSVSSLVYEDASKLLKYNEELYPEGSEFGTDKGYGFYIYWVDNKEEFKTVFKENNVDIDVVEFVEVLENQDEYILKLNYLVSCDGFLVIYLRIS